MEHDYTDLRSALTLVATGLAVTILPGLLCDDPPEGVAILSLPEKGRTVEAVTRSGSEEHPAIIVRLGASPDFGQHLRELASRLAQGPAGAHAFAKYLLTAGTRSGLEEHLVQERRCLGESAATADFRAGVEAFTSKTPARFSPRRGRPLGGAFTFPALFAASFRWGVASPGRERGSAASRSAGSGP